MPGADFYVSGCCQSEETTRRGELIGVAILGIGLERARDGDSGWQAG
jgi:hypothetical protein